MTHRASPVAVATASAGFGGTDSKRSRRSPREFGLTPTHRQTVAFWRKDDTLGGSGFYRGRRLSWARRPLSLPRSKLSVGGEGRAPAQTPASTCGETANSAEREVPH